MKEINTKIVAPSNVIPNIDFIKDTDINVANILIMNDNLALHLNCSSFSVCHCHVFILTSFYVIHC